MLTYLLMLAAGLGLEPRYSAPEADVLPLDDPAIRSIIRKNVDLSKQIKHCISLFELKHNRFRLLVLMHKVSCPYTALTFVLATTFVGIAVHNSETRQAAPPALLHRFAIIPDRLRLTKPKVTGRTNRPGNPAKDRKPSRWLYPNAMSSRTPPVLTHRRHTHNGHGAREPEGVDRM